jgi:hypothetical protein
MEIRGTEFNLIHNSKNKVTTALSFHGDLEFSSSHKSSLQFQGDLVKIKPGPLSTIPAENESVVYPVKL